MARLIIEGLACAAVAAVIAVPVFADHAPPEVVVDPHGGAAGGHAYYFPNGDIIGVRNIQCGTLTSNPFDLNCDIGAGSTQNPGNIVLNWDVGKCTYIYDGSKGEIARFCGGCIRLFRSRCITPKDVKRLLRKRRSARRAGS